MSILSAQCDELRTMAAMFVVKGLPEVASVVRNAADTILELRDDLQRANGLLADAEHDESRAWDRVRKAEAENAKLWELVEDMLDYIEIREAFDRPPTSEMCKEFAQRAARAGNRGARWFLTYLPQS